MLNQIHKFASLEPKQNAKHMHTFLSVHLCVYLVHLLQLFKMDSIAKSPNTNYMQSNSIYAKKYKTTIFISKLFF